jgi:hypothetical protein
VDEREFETSTLDEFVDGDASEWEDDEDDGGPPQCATQ